MEKTLVTPFSGLASWVLSQLPLWWLSLYQLWMYIGVLCLKSIQISIACLLLLYYPVYSWISQIVHKFLSSESLRKWAIKKKAVLISSEPVWWGLSTRKIRNKQSMKGLLSQQYTESKWQDFKNLNLTTNTQKPLWISMKYAFRILHKS